MANTNAATINQAERSSVSFHLSSPETCKRASQVGSCNWTGDSQTIWPAMSQRACSYSAALHAARQRDSLTCLAAPRGGSGQESAMTLLHDWHGLLHRKYKGVRTKASRANRQSVPLCASFCRRTLRRCRAEEEMSYVCRSAPATSWHLPNTPSAEDMREEKVGEKVVTSWRCEARRGRNERTVSGHRLWSDKVELMLRALV